MRGGDDSYYKPNQDDLAQDPPNPPAGYYYNVYLHHSGQDGDSLPAGWAMGQGTDPYGFPFLTIGIDDSVVSSLMCSL